jgi:hypothetical protein
MGLEFGKPTIDRVHEFDQVKVGPTYWTTISPFHPWCQTFIVEIMTARSEMCNQLVVGIDVGGVGRRLAI